MAKQEPPSPESIQDHLTIFEQMLSGAYEAGEIPRDFHTPIHILNGTKSAAEVEEARKNIGTITLSPLLFAPIKLAKDEFVQLTVEDLDLNSGKTLHDPIVYGIWHGRDATRNEETITKSEAGVLTQTLYTHLKEYAKRYPQYAKDLPGTYIRDGGTYEIESESPGDPEKG